MIQHLLFSISIWHQKILQSLSSFCSIWWPHFVVYFYLLMQLQEPVNLVRAVGRSVGEAQDLPCNMWLDYVSYCPVWVILFCFLPFPDRDISIFFCLICREICITVCIVRGCTMIYHVHTWFAIISNSFRHILKCVLIIWLASICWEKNSPFSSIQCTEKNVL